jgi:hypothetical protein
MKKPWKQGARWETTGWVWRGLEPPHAPPPRRWPRVPTQLSLNFNRAAVAVAVGAVSCDA